MLLSETTIADKNVRNNELIPIRSFDVSFTLALLHKVRGHRRPTNAASKLVSAAF